MNTVEVKEVKDSQQSSIGDPETIDLYDVLVMLAQRRRLISTSTLCGLLVGSVLCFLIKPYFTATAIILPPQQQSSSSAAMLGQLSSMASLGASSAVLGLKTSGDMYVGILGSRTIADAIIKHYNLQEVYELKKAEDTRVALKEHTVLTSGKDGLIYISVTDHDPNRASDLANGYVAQLYVLNSQVAISEAAQRRVFFEQQIAAEKQALADAEDDFRATQQKTGIIQVTGQAQAIIQSIAQLRARIASTDVELQALRVSATDQNPDVIRLQQEISTMRAQLVKLENSEQREQPRGEVGESAGSVPQGSLEYARKYREVQHHEILYDMLARQYEAARIDEAKSAPIIQIIDQAVPPDKKAGPKRSIILLSCLIVSFLGSCIWTFFAHSLASMREVPETAQKLATIRRAFRQRT